MEPSKPSNPAQPVEGGASWRESMKVVVPIVVLTIAAFAIAWHFVQPAPPKKVVIATGSHSGMYYGFAKQYADYFKANGVELDVRETAGSVENYRLLTDPQSGVDIAMVQSGSAPPPEQRLHLQAVAGIYYEPVLLFYRGETHFTQLSQLAGKKIAIGAEGSGVRMLATMLLTEAGVTDGKDSTTLSDLAGDAAASALADGKIDAVIYVIAPTAPVVTRLLGAPGVHLMSFEHAHADSRRHSFLSAVTLYRGSIDIQHDLPNADVDLIAPPATLVIRDTTHQAIIQLLVGAAEQVHGGGTLLSEPGVFPSNGRSELPLSKDAHYFLTTKPGFLHRTFPFWLASMIDRLLILLLPLLVVLLPLTRMMPPLLKWRVRRRIYRWYRRVRIIDERLTERSPPAALEAGRDAMTSIEKELVNLRVPLSYTEELYNLRLHVGYVKSRVEGWLETTAKT